VGSDPGVAVAELVAAVRDGGPEAAAAWEQLVARHVRLVWKVVHGLGLSGDDRRDAFQSTWLRAVERLDSIRDPDRFPGWLAAIALNEGRAILRRQRRLVPTAEPEVLERPEAPAPSVAERDELQAALHDGFERLDPRCRRLLRLCTADPPVSYREMEDILEMPHGSLGPTRRRCLDKLRATPEVAAYLAEED
jgi:RNA polymerase sigma factor (sigma-70 family)